MNLCRLCGIEQYLDAMCDLKDPELAIELRLEKVFKLKLYEDVKLASQTICLSCYNQLENSLDFYDTVVTTQANLLVSLDEAAVKDESQSGDIKLEMLIDDAGVGSPITMIESIAEEEMTTTSLEVVNRRSRTRVKLKKPKEIKITIEHSNSNSLRTEDIFSNEFMGTYSTQPDSLELENHETCPDGSLTESVAKSFAEGSWPTYEWRCSLCSNEHEKLIFPSKLELDDHHKLQHRDEKISYSCNDCPLSFKSYFCFHNHIIEHRPVIKFSCDCCSKIFWNLMDLHNHRQSCNPKLRHTCLYCGKVYESGFFLKQHAGVHQTFHPEDLFYCDLCNFSAHTKFLIKQHLTLSHVGKEKELACEICGKTCKRSSDMRSHMLVHTTHRPHKCDLCNLSFKCPKQLKCHKRTHFTKNLVEECEICHKKFMTKAKLARHFKIHTDEFDFTCEFCGRKFKHASGFNTHRRIHTGERPYLCKYENCGQRFIDWPNMNKHCKAKHSIDNSSRKEKVYIDDA